MNPLRAGVCWSRCGTAIDFAVAARFFQHRSFSLSRASSKKGGIPSFTEVSSPELQDLLSQIRVRIFLPTQLHAWQSKQLNRLRSKPKDTTTQGEPLLLTVAGEEFRISSSDAMTMRWVPALRNAIGLMKDKRDYDNLPALLRGFDLAFKDPAKFGNHLRFAIKNCTMDRYPEVLLECVRQGKDTGMLLKTRYLAIPIFDSFVHKMFASKFDLKETKRALLWAEQTAALMESPAHAGECSLGGSEDPRTSYEVIGCLMQLAAVHAMKHLDGKDEDGKVASYLEKFMNTPDVWHGPPKLDSGSNVTPIAKRKAINESERWFKKSTELVYGMDAVLSVLPQSSYAPDLRIKRDALQGELEEVERQLIAARKSTSSEPISTTLYDELLGSK